VPSDPKPSILRGRLEVNEPFFNVTGVDTDEIIFVNSWFFIETLGHSKFWYFIGILTY